MTTVLPGDTGASRSCRTSSIEQPAVQLTRQVGREPSAGCGPGHAGPARQGRRGSDPPARQQRHALSGIGIVVSLALAVLLWRGVRSRLEAAAYVGLIGGALGNVIDRLRIGAVVDYLDLYWRDMHWPAFNLADAWVVGAAGLLVLASFKPGVAPEPRGQGGTS